MPKSKKKRSKKIGRPKIEIDAQQVEKLAHLHCTNVEIAEFFGVDEGTIRKRFSEILEKGRAGGKMRLRRLQWKSAEGGNVLMQMFLGKQILGQADKTDTKHDGGIDIRISYAKNGKGKS